MLCIRGFHASGLLIAVVITVPAASQSTVRDSAGVRIVESTRPAWPTGKGWTLSQQAEIDIGSGDDSLYQLATVMGAVRLQNGRIAVANMGTSNIRMFDAKGRYVSSIGRNGQGPGEFEQVMGLLRIPGDTLAVLDQKNEVEYYAADGKFARGLKTPQLQNALVLSEFLLFDDGSYARSSWPQGHDHPPGRWVDSLVVLAFTGTAPQGTVISRHPAVEFTKTTTLPGPQRVTFGPTGTIVAAGDGYFVGFPERYEIRHHRIDGRLDAILRAAWTPRPISSADIERYKEFLINMGAERGSTVPPRLLAQRKKMMEEAAFARQLPAYSMMMVDTDRNLWVASRTSNGTLVGASSA